MAGPQPRAGATFAKCSLGSSLLAAIRCPRQSLVITLCFLPAKETKEVIDKSQGERKVVKERGDGLLSGPPAVFPECLSEEPRWPPLFRPLQHTLGLAIAPCDY